MNERRRIVDSHAIAKMSDRDYAAASAAGDLDLLKRGVDIRHGATLTRGQWAEVLDNLTPEGFGQAREAGLLAPLDKLLDESGAAEPAAGQAAPVGSADQGSRGTPGLGQIRREDLAGMSLEAYAQARASGRLTALLRGDDR